MANPVVVPCTQDAWTKVATGVTTGVVHILKTDPDKYLQTYRVSADPAPVDNSDAVPFDTPLQISAAALIDVYIQRSEERRVGKKCRLKCRSRWSPVH